MSKLKKLLVTSLSAALLGACIVPVASALVKASATENWSEVEIGAEYLVDEKVTIPERTLTIGGETYEAAIKMTYPNGSTKWIESGEFVLETAGEYALTYEVFVGQRSYTETEEFFVANKLWSVSNAKSSVEYGTVGETNALLVRLAKGDTLTFNKIVNLADYTSSEDLLKGFINPDTVGSNDFEKLIFKFTDAYDPSQVLTVRANKSTGSVNATCGSYWTAAGPNQTLGGWDENAKHFNIKTQVDDGICGTYRGVSFCSLKGTWIGSSLPFATEEVTADTEHFTIRFDQATKEVTVLDRSNARLVADLDKPEYYESEPLWKGFTSGQVIVSVMAEDYAAETANFAISKLFGYDLSVENKFVEEDAPIITVDVDEKYVAYDAALDRYSFIPEAVVGGKYPVPEATAFDGYSGDLEVQTNVYFDYVNTKVGRKITNGTFDVHSSGIYAIVYTAKDEMGNVAERIYWVSAVKKSETPLALTVNKGDATTNGICGERITLADYSVTGGSGDPVVTITATCGETVLDVTDGALLAEQAGAWTITYQAKDYSGITVEDTYEITVALGDKPVFIDLPVFPRYLISGMEYVVPTVNAYDYSSGTKVEKLAELEVTDANGTKAYKAGEAYTPVADANGSIGLRFVCESASAPIEIGVVTPKTEAARGVEIEKMFISEGVDIVRDKNGLTMTSTVDGSFSWLFANALAADGASVKTKGIQGESTFDGMKVTFTDYEDSSIAVTMYVEHNERGTLLVKFGDTNREITKGFNLTIDESGRALNEITFSYKVGKFYVDSLGVNVKTDDNGQAFNGFPSGKIYMSSETFGVEAGEKYIIEQIDNHVIGARARDAASPRVAITGNYGGLYNVNSEYVVTSALASDVIDPNVDCSVTVTSPSGKVVKDVNGVELQNVPANIDYTIKLVEYGQYQVTYKSTDWAGEEGVSTYAVNIFDQRAPKLSIKGEWSATAKVGDVVVLPEVEIRDDSSSFYEISVYRMVRNPFDVLTVFGYDRVFVEEGLDTPSTADDKSYWKYTEYSFTFKYVGEYKFIIVAADAAGNQTYIEYVVTVS
ncbi:MAG: hypothetical protein J6K86_05730 [Clostridia bacterium]|nr:hypothetical protein [Clostridia bacterium]